MRFTTIGRLDIAIVQKRRWLADLKARRHLEVNLAATYDPLCPSSHCDVHNREATQEKPCTLCARPFGWYSVSTAYGVCTSRSTIASSGFSFNDMASLLCISPTTPEYPRPRHKTPYTANTPSPLQPSSPPPRQPQSPTPAPSTPSQTHLQYQTRSDPSRMS
jgi:hypothetical protein